MDKKNIKKSLKVYNLFSSYGKILLITKNINKEKIKNLIKYKIKKINKLKINKKLNKIILTPYE